MQSPLLGALLGCPIARHARRIQAVLSRTQDRSNRLQLSYVFRKYTYTESTCFLSRIQEACAAFLVEASFPLWEEQLGVDPSLALEPLDLPEGTTHRPDVVWYPGGLVFEAHRLL